MVVEGTLADMTDDTRANVVTTIEYETSIQELDKYRFDESWMPRIVMYALGLAGEAGEVADKIKKVYRDKNGVFSGDDQLAIIKELGDCLWYMTRIAGCFGFGIMGVARFNLAKLFGRRDRGTQAGSGDNR